MGLLISDQEEDWEVISGREDLTTESLESALPEIIKRIQEFRELVRKRDYTPLGKTTATIEVHEPGVVLHFPQGKRRGLLVSLDREAAKQLSEFVSQYEASLQRQSESVDELRPTIE